MPGIQTIGEISIPGPGQQSYGKSKLGKNDFLNLLVTQLRFQNPLEPIKDSDFVAQLAQFSSLEELSGIGTSLDYSTQLDYVLSQTIANTMATTLIGKVVVADGNQIHHSYGASDELHFSLDADSATVEIKIYNDAGALIRTINQENLPEGRHYVTWDGRDDSGAEVPAGDYTFSLTAQDSEGDSVEVQTRIVGLVESVRYQDGQGYLIVNGQEIALSDIIEVDLDDGGAGGTHGEDEEDWS